MSYTAYAHFIGIGGAGMSGLARVLHDRGAVVTGSDLKASRYAVALQEAGVRVSIGHAAENLGDPEVVVISSAIPESNPELSEARARGIDVWPRAKMLAHLAGDTATLAVAGTHGKTTTSSMLAMALDGMGADPTFLIGGELNDMGANARCGRGDYYVVEADESDGSFLYLKPHVAIITNMEPDHLDHYGSFDAIVETFGRFIGAIDRDGVAVVYAGDPQLVNLTRESAQCRVVTYGSEADEDADVWCSNLERDAQKCRFTVMFPDGTSVAAQICVPGMHNVINATGVLAALWSLGLGVEPGAAALAGFSGVRRRFDRVGEVNGVVVVDDYAHHPTEIRTTLAAARGMGYRRIWAVFQPHRYSRTAFLAPEFGEAFKDADRVVLMDVYSAGEAPIPGISGKTVLDELLRYSPHAQAAYFPHRSAINEYVTSRVRAGDLVITMGAGDVTTIGSELVHILEHASTGVTL